LFDERFLLGQAPPYIIKKNKVLKTKTQNDKVKFKIECLLFCRELNDETFIVGG
jgi:hypothetical protein